MSTASNVTQNEATRRWASIRSQPGNDICAECAKPDTSWCSLDYGILICVRCAGAHRGLGTHISKVRSTQHDVMTDAEFDWVESLGNAKSNARWEGALPASMRRPGDDAPSMVRRVWLREKYDEQRYVDGICHTGALPHELQCGFLHKQGSLLPTWKRRFFCVRDGALLYYTDESRAAAALRGALPLKGATLLVDDDAPLALRLRTLPITSCASSSSSSSSSSTPRAAAGSEAADASAGRSVGGGSDGGGGGGSGSVRGSGGGATVRAGAKAAQPSVLLLRAASAEDAERWAWALYQCAHEAATRAVEAPLPQRKGARGSILGLLGGGNRQSVKPTLAA